MMIASLFNISHETIFRLVFRFYPWNFPTDGLISCFPLFLKVCIKVGSPPDVPLCTFSYSLQYNEQGKPTENCTSIINEKFGGDAAAFFSLNPGLYCDRLTVPTDPIGAPISQVKIFFLSSIKYMKVPLFSTSCDSNLCFSFVRFAYKLRTWAQLKRDVWPERFSQWAQGKLVLIFWGDILEAKWVFSGKPIGTLHVLTLDSLQEWYFANLSFVLWSALCWNFSI